MQNGSYQLLMVVSQPRSGSTALLAEFERYRGVVCIPESYFPQMLGLMKKDEIYCPELLAAYYLLSCDDGALLSYEEAIKCMVPGEPYETLKLLSEGHIAKSGKKVSEVGCVVWKTTRLVSECNIPISCGFKYVVLRRKHVNVFESQFKVAMGRLNRKPIRFMAFRESYESVYRKISAANKYEVDFENIPTDVPLILADLGLQVEAAMPKNSLIAASSAKHYRHARVVDGFQSKDTAQFNNVSFINRLLLSGAAIILRPLRCLMYPVRRHYDLIQMKKFRVSAGRSISSIANS